MAALVHLGGRRLRNVVQLQPRKLLRLLRLRLGSVRRHRPGEKLRATGYCGAGSTVTVRLSQRTGNVSSAIASIVVNVAGYFDVTQSVAAGGFLASASDNSLAIEMIEQGQGICTVTALIVDLS